MQSHSGSLERFKPENLEKAIEAAADLIEGALDRDEVNDPFLEICEEVVFYQFDGEYTDETEEALNEVEMFVWAQAMILNLSPPREE